MLSRDVSESGGNGAVEDRDREKAHKALSQANGDGEIGISVARFAAKQVGAGPLAGRESMEPLAYWLSVAAEGSVAPIFWKEFREAASCELGEMDAGVLASSFDCSYLNSVSNLLSQAELDGIMQVAKEFVGVGPCAILKWTREISQQGDAMGRAARVIVSRGSVIEALGEDVGLYSGERGAKKLGMATESKRWLVDRAIALSRERLGEGLDQTAMRTALSEAVSGAYEFEEKNRMRLSR